MTTHGKSLSQLQAEAMADKRFADLMASAGVGSYRIGQELMWMLPRPFLDTYESVFVQAFGSKDDGGVNARGQSAATSGELQKGKTAAKTNGKRYKKHWVIADEAALNLKDRMDKRLRALAREAMAELDEIAAARRGGANSARDTRARGKGKLVRTCSRCGRMASDGWTYCPNDGQLLDADADADAS